MENAAQSARPSAKIIAMHPHRSRVTIPDEAVHPIAVELYALEYIDQLLAEHFQSDDAAK